MTPKDFIAVSPYKGGTLYYPGSGSDYGPLRLFGESGAVDRVIYADYRNYNRSILEYAESMVGWDVGLSAIHEFGIQNEIITASRHRIEFIFATTEAVRLYPKMIEAKYAPSILVLQDHGFSGNWTIFGGDHEMYRDAKRLNALPDLLFVANNTKPWPGYSRASNYVFYDGQMHHHKRALYQKDNYSSVSV